MSSKSVYFKDISFYEDGSFFSKSGQNHMTLLSSTLDVSSMWVLQSLIVQALSPKFSEDDSINVHIFSFVDRSSVMHRGLIKSGLDTSKLASSKFSYKIFQFDEDISNIAQAVRNSGISSNSIVFFDLPPLILEYRLLLDILAELTTKARDVFIIGNEDKELMDDQEYKMFYTALRYKANLEVKIRALETGRAEDVTGIFKVLNGAGNGITTGVREDSYQYLVTGDNMVKLFFR